MPYNAPNETVIVSGDEIRIALALIRAASKESR